MYVKLLNTLKLQLLIGSAMLILNITPKHKTKYLNIILFMKAHGRDIHGKHVRLTSMSINNRENKLLMDTAHGDT